MGIFSTNRLSNKIYKNPKVNSFGFFCAFYLYLQLKKEIEF